MASNDSIFKAGETKGQAQEKTGTMMENLQKNTQWATDRVCETAQAAKNTVFGVAEEGKNKTCEAKDKAVESKDQTGSFLTDKAVFAKDKAVESKDQAGSFLTEKAVFAKDKTVETKDQTGSFLNDKAVFVKDKAFEAADAVKNTLGFGADNTKTPGK